MAAFFQQIGSAFAYSGSIVLSIKDGLLYTLGLFFITALLSLPLGLGLCFLRISKNRALRGFTAAYVWLLRGTPLLLQLFFVCYGLAFIPYIGKYLVMGRFESACVAFVLNYAAYFCEIFRGGILSIDKGQYEAAQVLGFSKGQTTLRIVIPQMLKVSLPSITNECILVKDTALVTAIGITELLYFSKSIVNRDVNPMAYVVVAAIYLIMTYGLTALFKKLEARYRF